MESSQNVGMPAKRKPNFWIAFGICLEIQNFYEIGELILFRGKDNKKEKEKGGHYA